MAKKSQVKKKEVPRFLFLQKDLDELDRLLTDLQEQLKNINKMKGESATQSSETWHDNFVFEEADRQHNMWAQRLEELSTVRRHAQAITPADLPFDVVSVGKHITMCEEVSDKKIQLELGSYMVLAPEHQKRGMISYNSPLAQMLLGAREGEKREGAIGGTPKVFVIKKILYV